MGSARAQAPVWERVILEAPASGLEHRHGMRWNWKLELLPTSTILSTIVRGFEYKICDSKPEPKDRGTHEYRYL